MNNICNHIWEDDPSNAMFRLGALSVFVHLAHSESTRFASFPAHYKIWWCSLVQEPSIKGKNKKMCPKVFGGIFRIEREKIQYLSSESTHP